MRKLRVQPAPLPVEFSGAFLTGRQLYEEVIRDGILRARRSIWIATANLKELYVERLGARRRAPYRSLVEAFDELISSGVEIRILHAELPSRPFREEFDRHPLLLRRLQMKQ